MGPNPRLTLLDARLQSIGWGVSWGRLRSIFQARPKAWVHRPRQGAAGRAWTPKYKGSGWVPANTVDRPSHAPIRGRSVGNRLKLAWAAPDSRVALGKPLLPAFAHEPPLASSRGSDGVGQPAWRASRARHRTNSDTAFDTRHLNVAVVKDRWLRWGARSRTWVEIGWRRFGLFAPRLQDSLAGILGAEARCARLREW